MNVLNFNKKMIVLVVVQDIVNGKIIFVLIVKLIIFVIIVLVLIIVLNNVYQFLMYNVHGEMINVQIGKQMKILLKHNYHQ